MRDIPIIFSAPMILALLREAQEPGTGKSMTRRLAWGKPRRVDPTGTYTEDSVRAPSPWQKVKTGDRLWVKESCMRYGRWIGTKQGGKVSYRFDATPTDVVYAENFDEIHPTRRGRFGCADMDWHLRPSIFMPRGISRLTLVVTETKIERLRDISEQDCEREGLVWDRARKIWGVKVDGGYSPYGLTAQECFMNLFCDLHGPAIWNDNPEVVALTFKVHAANVDAMKEAA